MNPKKIYFMMIAACLFILPETVWSGWQIQKIDDFGGGTKNTSIALDSNNNPHISYAGIGVLKYAKWTGVVWSTQTLYSGGDDTSIALDSNDYFHIAFSDDIQLKYTSGTSAGWQFPQIVDPALYKGSYNSIALDSSNNPHISYRDWYNFSLKYAAWNGTSWSTQTVDSADGYYTSIALDSNNNPHISYYDTNGNLKYAKWTGTSWSTQTVNSSAGETGWSTSIALDSSNNPHISYSAHPDIDLKYAKWTGSSWQIQIIGSEKGFGISIALDSSNNPHISYGASGLKYAKWTGSSWQIQTVDSETGTMDGTSIALDLSNGPHISYINWTNNYLKYAKWVPPAPGNFAGSPLGISSLTWTWASVTGAISYNFYPSTGGAPMNLGVTTLTQIELSTNTAYGARVSAVNASGEGPLTATTTLYTLAAPPTGFALVNVAISSITLQWAANTNPFGTTTYRLDRWTTGGSTTSVTVSVISAALTGLTAATTYYLTVQALNGNGVLTPSDIILSTVTMAPLSALSAIENIGSGGGSVVFNSPNGQIRVDIPAGAFSEAVAVTLQTPASFPSAASPTTQLKGAGVGIEITLDKTLQPAKDVDISISYQNASLPADTDESKLIVARYDLGRNVWVPLVSTPDPIGNKVTAKTNHFSIFQIMEASPSNTVSTAKAFPNPFRPSQGHTSMTFAALPANAKIKIYTLLGELIKNLTTNASGMASWDGTNESGAEVASGVYFVFAKGEGGKKTIKVAIHR